jgi:glutathione S-transferase
MISSSPSKKVAIVLEELGLTYETIHLNVEQNEHKTPVFTKYNPNGRIPAIIDHKNNDYVLWCAIQIPIHGDL